MPADEWPLLLPAFSGGVSAKDARALAPMLYCGPELIEAQQKGSFAAHVRGQTKAAVPLAFPFGYMEALPHMNKADRVVLRQTMRDRYAVHYSELEKDDDKPESSPADVSAGPVPEEPKPVAPQTARKPRAEPSPEKKSPGHIDTDAGDSW